MVESGRRDGPEKARYSESRYTIGGRSENKHTYVGGSLNDAGGPNYYRHRMYHAQLGRFCSRDPIGYKGSSWNLYEQGDSNVPNLGDPLGLTTASYRNEFIIFIRSQGVLTFGTNVIHEIRQPFTVWIEYECDDKGNVTHGPLQITIEPIRIRQLQGFEVDFWPFGDFVPVTSNPPHLRNVTYADRRFEYMNCCVENRVTVDFDVDWGTPGRGWTPPPKSGRIIFSCYDCSKQDTSSGGGETGGEPVPCWDDLCQG